MHAFDLSATTVAAGDTIQATFEVHNFEFSMEGEHGGHEHLQDGGIAFRAACPVGHVHVYLDDLETNPIAMQEAAEGDVVIPTDASAGQHTLIARLHNADHTIIEPQVMMEVTITVQ